MTKRNPWLSEPLRIFGIAITPPLYYVMNNMTIAQVELMASDVAVLNTRKPKEKNKDGFTNPDKAELEDAVKRWQEKYGKNGENKDALSFNSEMWKPSSL